MKLINGIKRFYYTLLLREKIAVAFSFMIVVLLIIQGSILYSYSIKNIESEMVSGARQTVEQVCLNIDSYFDGIRTVVGITATNQTFIESVENYYSNYDKRLEYDQNLSNILSQYTYMIPYIEDIIVVKDGTAIYNKDNSTRKDYNFNNEEWFSKNLGKWMKTTFVGTHLHDYYYDKPITEHVISAIIPIIDMQKGNKMDVGALIFDIGIDKINSIFNKLNLDTAQNVYILDSSGKIVASKDNQLIGQKLENDLFGTIMKNENGSFIDSSGGKKLFVVYSTSSITGWKTMITTQMTKVEQVSGRVRVTTILIIITAVLIALVISTLISSRITKSISKLKTKMNEVSRGDYLGEVVIESNDEVGVLSRHFNNMVVEIRKLINENYLVKIKQKEAELSALQSKINPHFLNNTLQSIHSMAVLNRTKDIENTIEVLSELFDYVLYESGEVVPIKDEIRYLECYLQIQKSRNKRLEYTFDVDKSVENQMIPKLLLQPLVENALIHGLVRSLEGGIIEVTVKDEDDSITFLISDNGQGMSLEKLEQVNRMLCEEESNEKSIGLKNVYERIKLKYEDNGVFEIKSIPNEGTCITVKIPKRLNIRT